MTTAHVVRRYPPYLAHSPRQLDMTQGFLICGILSSLIYVATEILGAMHYPGYSFRSQAVSELGAIGAPSATIVALPFALYCVLLVAFALGVWRTAESKRSLRFTALMLGGITIVGLGFTFFPMHMRGAEKTVSDTMHLVTAAIQVPFILLTIGFGAVSLGRSFRIYSIATIVVLFVFGVLTGLQASLVDANLPTPWLGVTERVNVWGYLLWVIVLAVALLRRSDPVHPHGE
jgi:hypothetical membrane protein